MKLRFGQRDIPRTDIAPPPAWRIPPLISEIIVPSRIPVPRNCPKDDRPQPTLEIDDRQPSIPPAQPPGQEDRPERGVWIFQL
jgi:hypothetical protein